MRLPGGVTRVRDTCNVYVIANGREATLVDVGSGAIFDRLGELGIDRVTDVLLTHAHRDVAAGTARAAAEGARVWVPPVEQDLVARADERWLARRVANDYDVRQDRFGVLESVPVAGTVDEYRTRAYGGVEIYALPTPGHSIGSVTYLVERDGRRLAFTGDLLYAPGRLWSVSATQWSYGGVEGQAATILSLGVLARRRPDVLLPAHGEPMEDASGALAATKDGVAALMELRRSGPPWNLDSWLTDPWEELSPHLLRNRTSIASSYALLSDSGGALIVDWGYDLWTGLGLGGERSANRPLLQSIEALHERGVDRVEVVVPTHYHDDHVAGINLLHDVEGAEVWAPANVAPILLDPRRYDLPCLWFDAVRVDRTLPLGEPVAWREYELTTYAQPGHTLYAAAIAFEVDGRRVLAIGDQQGAGGDGRDILNYQYRNRFRIDDYVDSAELYARLRPDLMISGHWAPREVTQQYLDDLLEDGRRLAELHRALLPDDVSFGPEGFGARIEPYAPRVAPGATIEFDVLVRNPFAEAATARVALVVPDGWDAEPAAREVEVDARGEGHAAFRVRVGGDRVFHARVAADVTVAGRPFGQQAEALVDVE